MSPGADGTKPPPAIPAGEVRFAFVRSPGPGGQNVNKLATACELRFHVASSTLLDAPGKERLRRLAGRRLTRDDEIVIEAHRLRTQEQNRRDALDRLGALIAAARHVPKARRKTKPTKGSVERRLESKRKRQRTKRLRTDSYD
ncbi:MAG: alternative ribosome rescue aminoacyl-tRNA hydrolase ArfB [Steroidobacteraceae bacterium]